MKVFPIFLNDLHNRRCVVIGGNHEAVGKVAGLLEVSANVTVVSAEVEPEIRAFADADKIEWVRRDYRPGDLEGAFLVISIRFDGDTNAAIAAEAEAGNALVNVMDDVPNCNFVAGSVVRRGDLVLAISTSGVAPALAVRLKQQLYEILDPAYETYLALLREARTAIMDTYPDFDTRRRIWYEIIDSDALELLRAGSESAARARINEIAGLSAK